MQRPTPVLVIFLLGLLGTVQLGSVAGAQTPVSAPLTVGLVLDGSGSLSVQLNAVDPNGSALRFAMDGNFEPLVASLPVNASTRNAILAQIRALENQTLLVGLFGDHDGIVNIGDVNRFEGLSRQGGQLLPNSPLPGATRLNVTLDGALPSSITFGGATFFGALGPVNSSLPITIESSIVYQFVLSGSSHRLTVSLPTNLLPAPVSGVPPIVPVSFVTPSGMSITQVVGLSSYSTSNDLWGWGNARTSGEYAPSQTQGFTIHFGAAFPLGDIVAIGVPVGAVAAGVGFLAWRRRRRRLAAVRNGVKSSGSA